MKPSPKTILQEEGDHLFSRLPYQEWQQMGQSYFIRVNRARRNALRRVKVIQRDEKILVFAYYFTTPQGGKGLLGYEVRPLMPPLSDVVGAAVFLRYGEEGPAAERYHKVVIGAEPCTLILLRCENGDILVMLTPKGKRRRRRRSR